MPQVYTICGHGTEPMESITVPEGCTMVVRQTAGCYMSKMQFEKHMKTLLCTPDLTSSLENPLGNLETIRKALGPVMIFKAGDTCPNFRFKLFIDHHFPSSVAITKLAGIIPLSSETSAETCNTLTDIGNVFKKSPLAPKDYVPATLADPKFAVYARMGNDMLTKIKPMLDQLIALEDKSRKNRYNSQVKKMKQPDITVDTSLSAKLILPLFYEHSIYPTKDEVRNFIEDDETTLQEVMDDTEFDKFITIDTKSLFEKFPGVYYHLVCRQIEDQDLSDTLFNVNVFPTGELIHNIPNTNHRQVPAIYNTPVLHMPKPQQHYIKQAIYEAERKKQFGRGYRSTKTRRLKRSRKTRRRLTSRRLKN